MRTACLWALVVVLLVPWARMATGHALAPSLLELEERPEGQVGMRFRTPLLRPTGGAIAPVLPERCRVLGEPVRARDASAATFETTLDCGPGGLVGTTLGASGLSASRTQVLVRVALADGRLLRGVLHADASSIVVDARTGWRATALGYLRLGFEHILGGLDHLLFVMGLLLLARNARALLATVTAFTIGHSATLTLAALAELRLPVVPVEIAIAASLLWLALCVIGSRDAIHPPLLAGSFGLLHGFGFAGGLTAAGLPQQDVPLALLAFNLGIEIGQLLWVAALLAALRCVRPVVWSRPRWLDVSLAYGLGSLGAFWLIQRMAAAV